MSGQGQPAQDLLDTDGEIFSGRNNIAEFLKMVQILMIEPVEDFAGDEGIERAEIADHSGLRGDGATDGDFEKIIVSVAVGIVALAVGVAIGLRAERGIVQAMRGAKEIAAGEVDLHRYSP